MRATTPATIRRDCLVVYIASDAELQRVLQEGYYRIPQRAVGQSIRADSLDEADMVALYQGGGVAGGLTGAIEYVAPIKRREVVRRRDLIPDEPTHPHADDSYMVLRLGRRRRLSRPIVSARPRRFSILRTTRARIRHAQTLSDLIVGNVAEERLWRRMLTAPSIVSEAANERKWLVRAGTTLMEVDVALYHGDRRVAVVRDGVEATPANQHGWRVISFSPSSSDDSVLKAVERLLRGGAGQGRV